MKKVLLFLLILMIIPMLSIMFFWKPFKFEFNKNNFIRVKYENGDIKKILFNEYLVGVLAAEMPLDFEKEALKAQAVAARTYALKKMENNKKQDYDILNTVANQVYYDEEKLKQAWGLNYLKNYNYLKSIILATNEEYLVYNDKIIDAFFYSTSPGMTENSADVFGSNIPYLVSVESKWDLDSPSYQDTKIFSLENIQQVFEINDKITSIKIIEYSPTGRSKKIKINDKIILSNKFREILGIKSTYLSLEIKNDSLHINTKGYGHGVGMSQYGAHGMAKSGKNYKEILKHYYKDVEIKKI